MNDRNRFSKRHHRFPKNIINEALEFILPQKFDTVISAFKSALWQIDPSWEIGQFDVFANHFRMLLFRSLFTRRLVFKDGKYPFIQPEEKILDKILEISQLLEDEQKAAFYGTVLSEYILQCPEVWIPDWANSHKQKPNPLIVWNLHSSLVQYFYW